MSKAKPMDDYTKAFIMVGVIMAFILVVAVNAEIKWSHDAARCKKAGNYWSSHSHECIPLRR